MSDEARLQWGWKSIRAAAGTETAAEAPAREVSGTFIGSGALFEGTLSLKGDFRIDSEFRGELCTDGTIVIGPNGSVIGNLRARQVEVHGAVVGNISARRLFLLHAGARLHGDIETACLEIQRHAFFQGATRMTEPQASTRAAAQDTRAPAPATPQSVQIQPARIQPAQTQSVQS
jgi:cytoskeletal protein CcmA (bactofilin family)